MCRWALEQRLESQSNPIQSKDLESDIISTRFGVEFIKPSVLQQKWLVFVVWYPQMYLMLRAFGFLVQSLGIDKNKK